MELNSLIEKCTITLEESLSSAMASTGKKKCHASATLMLGNGYAEISVSENDELSVAVYDNESEKCYHNISDFLERSIEIDRDAILEQLEEDSYMDDIWHRNGFESEEDYYHYRYGA